MSWPKSKLNWSCIWISNLTYWRKKKKEKKERKRLSSWALSLLWRSPITHMYMWAWTNFIPYIYTHKYICMYGCMLSSQVVYNKCIFTSIRMSFSYTYKNSKRKSIEKGDFPRKPFFPLSKERKSIIGRHHASGSSLLEFHTHTHTRTYI